MEDVFVGFYLGGAFAVFVMLQGAWLTTKGRFSFWPLFNAIVWPAFILRVMWDSVTHRMGP